MLTKYPIFLDAECRVAAYWFWNILGVPNIRTQAAFWLDELVPRSQWNHSAAGDALWTAAVHPPDGHRIYLVDIGVSEPCMRLIHDQVAWSSAFNKWSETCLPTCERLQNWRMRAAAYISPWRSTRKNLWELSIFFFFRKNRLQHKRCDSNFCSDVRIRRCA